MGASGIAGAGLRARDVDARVHFTSPLLLLLLLLRVGLPEAPCRDFVSRKGCDSGFR